MKIVTVIGARPQFIKAAVVSRAIINHNQLDTNSSAKIKEVIVHTGQHYDRNMSAVFFEEMNIPKPDYFLNINGLSHGAMTGQMLEKVEAVLLDECPDFVLVYGDTNTTLAGALAAVKLHIPVAHIEAGLRSFNRTMPEEINRILTDHASSLLFCPTQQAVQNLAAEGIGKGKSSDATKVQLVGDVMLDAAYFYTEFARKPQFEVPEKFILATIHRAENTDNLDRLQSILIGLEKICQEIPIILPIHPRTQKITNKFNLQTGNPCIHIVEPVGYLEMIYMLENCIAVITDSGGLQKEAYFFKKPCITLRDETEWVELTEHGFNQIAGTATESIYAAYKNSIAQNYDFSIGLYGDGKAGRKIVDILTNG